MTNFAADGDVIDVRGIGTTSLATFDYATNTLTLADLNGTHATIHLTGSYAGNVFVASSDNAGGTQVTIAAALAASISAALANDTGPSNTDHVTSDPTIAGTTNLGALVTFSEGGTTLGTTTADTNGHYSFDFRSPTGTALLADGAHTITVTESYLGQTTTAPNVALTLDTTNPTLTLALSAGTGVGINHPLITDTATGAQVLNAAEFAQAFRLGGTASDVDFSTQAGSTRSGAVVTFASADGHTVPAHSVFLSGSSGSYTYAFRIDGPGTTNGVNADLAAALTDGTYTVQTVTQDVAGNPGVTAPQTLIVDTTADASPAASLTVDSTVNGLINATEAAAVAFTVAGLDSDATAVATFTDGTHVQTVQVAADGTGSANLAGFNGSVTASLAITDIHQNTAAATGNAVQADTAAPTLAVSSVSGATNLIDGHVLSGTIDAADAGLSVIIRDGASALGTATVDGQGHFSLPFSFTGDGTTHAYALTASAMDAAGNVGTSDSFAFNLDFTPNQNLFGAVTHDPNSPGGEAYALYDGLLGRTGEPTGLENSANNLAHGVSVHDVAANFLVSNEFTSDYGGAYTTGSNDAFVQYLYHEALGRDPDATGQSYWNAQIANGASRIDVATGFALSSENEAQIAPALQAGVFVPDADASNVARLYYGLLDRTPDSGGLQTFTDMVHTGASLTSVAQSFLSSAEYAALHPAAQTDMQYVDSLYMSALGRSAEVAAENFWTDALASHMLDRAGVALGIAESSEAQIHLTGQIQAGWHLA